MDQVPPATLILLRLHACTAASPSNLAPIGEATVRWHPMIGENKIPNNFDYRGVSTFLPNSGTMGEKFYLGILGTNRKNYPGILGTNQKKISKHF